MDGSRAAAIKRLGRVALKTAVAILVITAVLYLALSLYANRKRKEAFASWEKAGYSLDKKYAELSDNEENPCAAEIRSIGGKLGLVSVEGNNPVKTDYKKVYDYTTDQLQKSGPQFIQPDKDVVELLEKAGPDIRRLREVLDQGLPVWGFKREDFGYNAGGHLLILGLERLLCAESLYALSKNMPEEAVMNLNAGIKLEESLRPKSAIVGALIFTATHKLILGAVRFMPSAPGNIREYLSSVDPVEVITEGFVGDTALLSHIENIDSASMIEAREKSPVSSFLQKPYLRLCTAGSCEINMFYLKEMEKEDPCSLGDSQIMKKVEEKIPRWNIFAAISTPNLQDMWVRAYRVKLDRDMTLIILKAKSEKTRTGVWPDSIELPKSICPKTSWKYEKNGETCAIRFDGEFKHPGAKGVILPLKWEE